MHRLIIILFISITTQKDYFEYLFESVQSYTIYKNAFGNDFSELISNPSDSRSLYEYGFCYALMNLYIEDSQTNWNGLTLLESDFQELALESPKDKFNYQFSFTILLKNGYYYKIQQKVWYNKKDKIQNNAQVSKPIKASKNMQQKNQFSLDRGVNCGFLLIDKIVLANNLTEKNLEQTTLKQIYKETIQYLFVLKLLEKTDKEINNQIIPKKQKIKQTNNILSNRKYRTDDQEVKNMNTKLIQRMIENVNKERGLNNLDLAQKIYEVIYEKIEIILDIVKSLYDKVKNLDCVSQKEFLYNFYEQNIKTTKQFKQYIDQLPEKEQKEIKFLIKSSLEEIPKLKKLFNMSSVKQQIVLRQIVDKNSFEYEIVRIILDILAVLNYDRISKVLIQNLETDQILKFKDLITVDELMELINTNKGFFESQPLGMPKNLNEVRKEFEKMLEEEIDIGFQYSWLFLPGQEPKYYREDQPNQKDKNKNKKMSNSMFQSLLNLGSFTETLKKKSIIFIKNFKNVVANDI